ncbi:arsenate reductase family protein [Aurantibacillus circumpalustris]|uniref:arsenate reductase family protein n=1 Tax=Aurantibacillus circumpalustris TaxID=3036359 RepID=UPI00295A5FAD|nr:arsenate reductase family protein [Aurantibacillus circumpalustris]
MIIYYNARCSKCRETLEILEKNKCEVTFREYLKEPPTKKEFTQLLKKLNCDAFDIVRKTEPLYKERFSSKKLTNTQWIKVLCENPILIERPIVIDGVKALVGRPPILVLDFIKKKSSKRT